MLKRTYIKLAADAVLDAHRLVAFTAWSQLTQEDLYCWSSVH
jgi:hypothetical protein